MVEIDLIGEKKETKEFPKVLLERTLTTGTVIEVGHWTSDQQKEKIMLSIDVDGKIVTCWMNASVKKGSDPAYNTLSYNNLEALGLLEDFKTKASSIKTLEDMEAYWNTKLLGKKIKFVPETINSKDGVKYSLVKQIEGFAQ